ncbi:dnaJ domain containing protein, putative [Babesia bigemina]|uniref:DnaJ domain containing protein, putative n=1 Tax=Babesia bigemina TaxID=5866 RepID=A0A061DD92_BABBI|nr:dnaJ domain containing protein, putative [Babesia bigemina]CDR97199.1 dnaJ domain containing protein, putative [Babesia bigemina]|eukprot:XP_012769385.1 dnaJ domain containing protein, putative [Babesia bigemina]
MAEEAAKPPEEDDVLNFFFSEIESIGKAKSDADIMTFNAKEMCLRLTSQTFASPYQVLQLKHDATEEEIKKRYRKALGIGTQISLLIHPDKFKHEKAQEAFNAVLLNAFNEIQKSDSKEKYKLVYEEAKKIVYKRHKANPNATTLDLIAAGVLDSDIQQIENEIQRECDEILRKQQERREYAEKCVRANMEYEKQLAAEQVELEKQQLNHQVEWDKTRDLRVTSWRSFQGKVTTKDFKLQAFRTVDPKREQRPDVEGTKRGTIAESQTNRKEKRKKIVHTDEYKASWR